MKTIISDLTRNEAGVKIAELIHCYYMGNSMGQSIGFNYDGEPDYGFNVHGATDIALEVFNSDCGDSFFGDEDPYDEKLWTDEFINDFGPSLLDPNIYFQRDVDDEVEIVFADDIV